LRAIHAAAGFAKIRPPAFTASHHAHRGRPARFCIQVLDPV
jgi:hypothetical protein